MAAVAAEKAPEESISVSLNRIVSHWHTMPYSLQATLRERARDPSVSDHELVAFLSRPKTDGEVDSATMFFDSALEPARSKLVVGLSKIFAPAQLDVLLSRESFDTILGVVHLNNVEVQIFSPLHRFLTSCLAIRQPHKVDALTSLLSRISQRYGGELPVCKGSALFHKYAMANHSCSFNMYVSLSLRFPVLSSRCLFPELRGERKRKRSMQKTNRRLPIL